MYNGSTFVFWKIWKKRGVCMPSVRVEKKPLVTKDTADILLFFYNYVPCWFRTELPTSFGWASKKNMIQCKYKMHSLYILTHTWMSKSYISLTGLKNYDTNNCNWYYHKNVALSIALSL